MSNCNTWSLCWKFHQKNKCRKKPNTQVNGKSTLPNAVYNITFCPIVRQIDSHFLNYWVPFNQLKLKHV